MVIILSLIILNCDNVYQFDKMLSSLRACRSTMTTARKLSSTDDSGCRGIDLTNKMIDKQNVTQLSKTRNDYSRAIQDLNLLQSNSQVLALAKYKAPEAILPLFRQQLSLAGVNLNDLNGLNIIHVSGTKGKGSTCAFAESILRVSGLKTGFYNSPHLVKVTERIKINGHPINEESFSKYFRKVFDRLVEGTRRENVTMPSYFSFLTILAFYIFLEEKVDCSLIEVGIGGEYDPTNVIEKPIACAITTLDFDHTNILGHTIKSIAWTKSGIIKPNAPIFTIEHDQKEALEMITIRAHERGSPLYICKPIRSSPTRDFRLGIDSKAQYVNASLACQLAKHLLIRIFPHKLQMSKNFIQQNDKILETDLTQLPKHFSDGLKGCQWPGRCQIIEYPKIVFFIDGAHTRKSMENCLEWFKSASNKLDNRAKRILMVNVIGERDKSEVLRPLVKYKEFSYVIFSTNRINPAGDTPKSETFVNMQGSSSEKSLENVKSNVSAWEKLQEDGHYDGVNLPKIFIEDNVMDGIKLIHNILAQNDTHSKIHILATGSLHFVGAVLETLQSVDCTKL